jgi:hypothetical protein
MTKGCSPFGDFVSGVDGIIVYIGHDIQVVAGNF